MTTKQTNAGALVPSSNLLADDLTRFEWLMKYVNADREEIDKRMQWEADNAKLKAAEKANNRVSGPQPAQETP
jgi:hypothetical protein